MTTDSEQPDTLSIAEAAERLGVTAQSLRRAIARDESPVEIIRIGGQRRIARRKLDALLGVDN